MKLLVDMNLSPRWIELLVDAGIDAAHWSTLGAKNAPDSEIMAYAKVREYVVLTHDLDFGAMLAATHGEKPSVVQIRAEDVNPDMIGTQLVAALYRWHLSWKKVRCSLLNLTVPVYVSYRFEQNKRPTGIEYSAGWCSMEKLYQFFFNSDVLVGAASRPQQYLLWSGGRSHKTLFPY